jgi:hypothetical protein
MPVDARGEFRLVAPTGRHLKLRAEGDVLRLDIPAWDDLSTLTPTSFSATRRFVRSASSALLTTGLRFELSVDGKLAVAIGTGVRPSLVSRILGLGSARFTLRRIPLLRFLR